MKRGTREDDERILMALHLVHNEQWTMKAAGEAVGMTKNAVIGQSNRVRYDRGICRCNADDNRTGGMEPLWWATSEHARGLVASLVSGRD